MAIKTAIEIGFVYFNVSLQVAVKSSDIGFNLLYKKNKQRIKYNKTCEDCPSKIPAEDIVKGYEFRPNQYVILDDKDFEKIKASKDKKISIIKFVNLSEIDPIYFDKAYYISPSGTDKTYKTLQQALNAENKVGIAKTVFGTKEQIVALRAVGDELMLFAMHFYEDIVENPVTIKDVPVSKAEVELAKKLIENMSGEFKAQEYTNEYRKRVLSAIEDKIKGQKIKATKERKLPNNVINLMDALKKSVENTKKPAKTRKKA